MSSYACVFQNTHIIIIIIECESMTVHGLLIVEVCSDASESRSTYMHGRRTMCAVYYNYS